MDNNLTISLIIPCYNEEVNIQKGVLDKIGNYTSKNKSFREVIIVDDGSKDNSRSLIKKKYLPAFPKFRIIENHHLGKAMAVITGIKNSKYDYVMFSDIDLATPIEEAEKLIKEALNGSQIIIGSRNRERRGAPLLRKIMAVGFILIRNMIVGLKGIRDTQCGFKMFDRKAANKIVDRLVVSIKKDDITGSSVSAGFDLEFIFLAAKYGYKISEIPVPWRHVETKNVSFFKDALETFKDIIYIKYLDLTGAYKK